MMKAYLKERRVLVDLVIEEYLNELKYPKVIAEGMKYSVLNGGKRLRPILLLMTLDLLGVQEKLRPLIICALNFQDQISLVH